MADGVDINKITNALNADPPAKPKNPSGGPNDFSSMLERAMAQAGSRGSQVQRTTTSAGVEASSDPHPQHFPLGRDKEDFHERMMELRNFRMQLIASNIANADTPGYKAVDIDIKEAAGIYATRPLALSVSDGGHLSNNETPPVSQFLVKYRVPYQGSVDGNTVEMDVERQHLVENTLMYQFSLDRVSGEFKDMQELLQKLT